MHSSLMMTQSPGICPSAIVLKTVWIQRVWLWPLQTQLFLRTTKAFRCCRRWAGREPAWAETRMVSQGHEHALLFFCWFSPDSIMCPTVSAWRKLKRFQHVHLKPKHAHQDRSRNVGLCMPPDMSFCRQQHHTRCAISDCDCFECH